MDLKIFLTKSKRPELIIAIVLAMGAFLRLFHYFYNRSLWMDEVYLCSSLIRMNYTQLATQALDYQQKAPIGFLWLVKLSVNLFGNGEKALRLIPLLSGLLSLWLFARISRYFLNPWAQLLAIIIFCFAPAITYHSVEIKQYATECLGTLLALYLFIKYQHSNAWKVLLIWGLVGAIILWFSFSVIFILAGIAVGMSLYYLFQKNWISFFRHLVPFFLWLISFGINYLLFTHKQADGEWTVYWFKVYDNFMPFPPHSLQELKWFPHNFLQLMDYPLGLAYPLIPSILLFSGMLYLWKHNRSDFMVLISGILFMLIASGIYLYPLLERFWLFIAPVLILFIAYGFSYFQEKQVSKKLLWLLFILVIASPIVQSCYYISQPQHFYKHKKSFEREGLTYINTHFKPGDAIYNYWNNSPGYGVYQKIYNFKYKAIVGHDFRKQSANLPVYNQNLQQDFKQFAGKKRVWLIYNTQFTTTIGDLIDDPKWYYKGALLPDANLIMNFQQLGKPLQKIVYSDITIYLFELDYAHSTSHYGS